MAFYVYQRIYVFDRSRAPKRLIYQPFITANEPSSETLFAATRMRHGPNFMNFDDITKSAKWDNPIFSP